MSSDHCRALVGDDETDQSVTGAAFGLLHTIIDKRLQLGRLTVIDATNVKPEDRAQLVEIARCRLGCAWNAMRRGSIAALPTTPSAVNTGTWAAPSSGSSGSVSPVSIPFARVTRSMG
ncbi:MAG: hypothetical protein GY708_02955 [Actinomycetia bacterium]|nr:hypothetical protein [Actinomycetes bacterium]